MIGTLGQFVREIRDLLSGSGDPIPVDIQDASVTINGDVTVSSEVEIKNDTGNPVPVSQINAIDSGNGYSGTMTANQVFTGTGIEASPAYGTISVCVFSSHASAANGLKFQASIDNINWETIEQYTYSSPNVLESYSFAPSGRYFRLTYTNGGTSTTKTAIFSVLRSGYTKPSSHRVGDPISAEKDAELVKAVLAAMKPNGTFTDINATAGGNLKFSLEEAETSVVLGIKDAGNSITVDGPLTNTELRASAVPVSAASLPLPSGAATSANQATANSSLSSIDGKLPALSSGNVPVLPAVQLGSGVMTSSTQRVTLATDGPGVTSLSNIDGKTPALINARAGVEPLGQPGVARQLAASSTSANTTLTTTCRRISVFARGADIRFAIGSSSQTASGTSHYIANGERLDLVVPATPNIAVIRAGSIDGTLEVTELV